MIYRPEDHTYWIGDTQVPSVSHVLKMCPVPIFLNKWLAAGNTYAGTEMAAKLGTDVHDIISNTLDGKPLEYENTARGTSLKKMVDYATSVVSEHKIIKKETPMISNALYFGGTPDLCTEFNNTTYLHDWKTNQKNATDFKRLLKKYEAQLGAYSLLLEEHGVTPSAGIVHHVAGQTSYPVSLETGRKNFLTLLEIYNGLKCHNISLRDVFMMWNEGMSTGQISFVVGATEGQILEMLSKYSIL